MPVMWLRLRGPAIQAGMVEGITMGMVADTADMGMATGMDMAMVRDVVIRWGWLALARLRSAGRRWVLLAWPSTAWGR